MLREHAASTQKGPSWGSNHQPHFCDMTPYENRPRMTVVRLLTRLFFKLAPFRHALDPNMLLICLSVSVNVIILSSYVLIVSTLIDRH